MFLNKIRTLSIILTVVFFISVISEGCCILPQTLREKIRTDTEVTPSLPQDLETTGNDIEDSIQTLADDGISEKFVDDGAEGKKISLLTSYEINATGETDKIEFLCTLPADYKYRQKIIDYDYSIRPVEVFKKENNFYARFILTDLPPYLTIDIETSLEIFDYDLDQARKSGNHAVEETGSLQQYLLPEENIEADDSGNKRSGIIFQF